MKYEYQSDNKITNLNKKMSNNKKDFTKEIEAMNVYNARLASGNVTLTDPFQPITVNDKSYFKIGNIDKSGIMGYIEIPSISVKLPIYHGSSSKVLEKGVGHLQNTSFPIGGKSTHSVLTGHTGLSSAKLFTDLVELKKKDNFLLHVVGKNLAYEVTSIKVVLPDQLSSLSIKNNQDLCTLVTCTPYGVNTHRLLVTGKRVNYNSVIKDKKKMLKKNKPSRWMREYKKALVIAFALFCSLILIIYIVNRYKRNI